MEQHIVKKSIAINAEPYAVWDALTNPEKTKEYFFNCKVHSDWAVGSPITFKGTMFWVMKIEMHGTILAIEPQKLLKYNLKNRDKGEGQSTSTVTDELTYKNGVTVLSITDDVGVGKGAKKRFEKSQKGWDKILTGLKKFVEKETTK